MNRSVAFTALPVLLLTSALAACSSGSSGSSSTPPSTVSSTASLAVGECAPEAVPASSSGALDDQMTADGSCRARGLALGSFDVASGTASYSCCKVEPQPIAPDGGLPTTDGGTSPPGTECQTDSLGSPTSSADPGTWKDDATKTCELRGETLSDFSVADPSGNGDFRFAKITCCEVAPPPPPPVCGCLAVAPGTSPGPVANRLGPDSSPIAPDGGVAVPPDGGVLPTPPDSGVLPPPVCECPPPPPTPVCSGGGFGNAKGTCTTKEDAYQEASKECAAQGLALTDFQAFQGDCTGDGVQSASFECCAVTVTPPPTPTCEETSFANAAGFCTKLADAQTEAADACEKDGQVLEDFTTTQGSCPAGSVSSGSYSCCGSEVVVPPVGQDAGAPVPTPKLPVSN